MTANRPWALACALILAAATTPSGPLRAQGRDSREPLVRTFDSARGSRIGATVLDIDDADVKQPHVGVAVETVESNGPAAKAGIKAGDSIVDFDGERVRSVRQFVRLVEESAPGRGAPVGVMRGGQRLTLTVTPEPGSLGDEFGMRFLDLPRLVRRSTPFPPVPPAPPAAGEPPAPPMSPGFDYFGSDGPFQVLAGRGRLGITTETLDGQLAEYFGAREGALVRSVQEGSAAARAGLKAGDVITGLNGSHVYDSSDVSRGVNRMEPGAEFTLDVVRDRKTQTLKGKLDTGERAGSRRRTRTRA